MYWSLKEIKLSSHNIWLLYIIIIIVIFQYIKYAKKFVKWAIVQAIYNVLIDDPVILMYVDPSCITMQTLSFFP